MALKKITGKDFKEALDALTPYGEGDVVWLKELGKTDGGTGLYLIVGWTRDLGYELSDVEANGFTGDNDDYIGYKIGYFNYKPGIHYMLQDFDDFPMPYNLKDDKPNGIYKGDVWDTDGYLSNELSSWDSLASQLNKDAQGIWDTWGENGELDLMESKKHTCSMQKKKESLTKMQEMHPMFKNWNPRNQAQVNNTLRLAMAECPQDMPELIKIVKAKGFDVPSGLTPATGWGSFESRSKRQYKDCSMSKKKESLAKKNEADYGAMTWTVTVEFDDNGRSVRKDYIVKAHNRDSAIDQAKLKPRHTNPDAKDIKVTYCKLGESLAKKNESSLDELRVSDEDVAIVIHDIDRFDDRFDDSMIPGDGEEFTLPEFRQLIGDLAETSIGFASASRDGSDIRVAIEVPQENDDGELTDQYREELVLRGTARIRYASLEHVADYLNDYLDHR